MKKKFYLFVLLLVCVFSPCGFAFDDIAGHHYQEDIAALYDLGIVKGYEQNLFKPDQTITRAELLTIIMKAAHLDIEAADHSCFADVFTGDWYADVVCSAKKYAIVAGYEDGTFKPNQPVLLLEALKIGIEGFGMEIKDKESGLRYQKYQDFADEKGIFSKYRYFPEQAMTRGMMAHLAHQLLKGLGGKRDQISGFGSFGCGKQMPSQISDTVLVDGVERHFILQVGKQYRAGRPAKLILGFHGRTSDNASVAGYYNLDEAGDDNAIYVYPLGLPEEGPTRSWRSGNDKISQLRDYALFDAIREKVEDAYCIDTNQIYVVGHSLGGWFTSMLGCARGAEIRGVGIVAGSPMKFPSCSGPVAAIIFHNPADNLASFAGGEQLRNAIIKQNRCSGEVREYPNSHNMDCVEYQGCLPGAEVVFCKYFEGQHMWPQGASSMMMQFFKKK